MPKTYLTPASQKALAVLTGVVVAVAVVGSLFWVQAVLIPVALAVFLAFPLTPLVKGLERFHLGRKLSVIVVVVCAALLLGGVGWLINLQFTGLANDLPTYNDNIQTKVKYLGQLRKGDGVNPLGQLTEEIADTWQESLGDPQQGEIAAPGNASEETITIVIPADDAVVESADQAEVPSWIASLPAYFSPVLATLAAAAMALVLVVFILLEREALRNRLIRLLGHGRMTETTKALDDAAARISRYLLMQLAVNGSYGVAWFLGLLLIGVDYALLWGFLAALLRYVPYLGAPLAALFPIALSLAQFPGWWQPIAVIAFFLTLELVSNNVIEPWLYGQSIGVSAVAMIIAAAFWTFLWGPVGLVLSGPLTVCLVVIGNHVPQLSFFAVLLGDAPALSLAASFYQRLLARDSDEAARLVLAHASATSAERVFDDVLIPALIQTKKDRERGSLTESDETYILQASHEVLEDLGERRTAALLASPPPPNDSARPPSSTIRILACPARDDVDRLALEMLRQLLNPAEWDVEVIPTDTLIAELVAHASEEKSALACIGSLPPGGLAHTRYLCKRLRARHPDIKIIVGRWGLDEEKDSNREHLQDVGVDLIGTTLLETRKQLNDWLPVLAYEVTKPQDVSPAVPGAGEGKQSYA